MGACGGKALKQPVQQAVPKDLEPDVPQPSGEINPAPKANAVNADKKEMGQRGQEHIDKIFDQYRNPETDSISGPTFEQFFADLGVNMGESRALVVCYMLGSTEIGVFTRSDFVQSFKRLNCTSLKAFNAKIPVYETRLQAREEFTLFWAFCFDISREGSSVRSLPVEVAAPLMELLLARFSLGPAFVEFLREVRPEAQKGSFIRKDEWYSLLPFLYKYDKRSLDDYSCDEAWPILVDDFVEWWMSKRQCSPGCVDA